MSRSRYIKAIEDALEEGCTDAAEGGVPSQEVAERVDADLDSVERHLRRLAKANQVEKVSGVDPETYRPRQSYLPIDSG